MRAAQVRRQRLGGLDVRVGAQAEEGGEAALGVDVDHQRPVALERQVLAQVHRGRGLGHAAFEVGDRDHHRRVGLRVAPGTQAELLLDGVDFLQREHAPAAGHGAAGDFAFLDGALQGLARQPEQLRHFLEVPAAQDLAVGRLQGRRECFGEDFRGTVGQEFDILDRGGRNATDRVRVGAG